MPLETPSGAGRRPAAVPSRALDQAGPRLTWLGLALLVFLGACLRWIRFDLRFNQITFAYAAYYQPVVSAFEAGDWYAVLTTFVGLHPPLYSILFAFLYHAWGAPAGYLLMSGVFSTAAVVAAFLLGREAYGDRTGLGAAALMAVSVYQSHYALEVNNYPLLTFVATLGQWTFLRALHRPDTRRLAGWIATMVAGLYTHALVAVLVCGQFLVFLGIHRRRYLRQVALAALAVAVACSPMIPPVLALVTSTGTYQNETIHPLALWSSVIEVMTQRFGPPAIVLLLVAASAAGAWYGLKDPRRVRATTALFAALGVVPAVAALIVVQVASAEQYPYYLSCLGPFLVLAARGFLGRGDSPAGRSPSFGWLALGFVCATEVAFALGEVGEARTTIAQAERRPHAIRAALARKPPPDVLWLIAPPLFGDDDKRAVDPVYLALPKWRRCRYYGLDLGFEYVNYAFGQPFSCGTMVMHTFTDIYPAEMSFLLDHYRRRGDRVSIVMYDVVTSPAYVPRLEAVLKPFHPVHQVVGGTHLYELGLDSRAGGVRAGGRGEGGAGHAPP